MTFHKRRAQALSWDRAPRCRSRNVDCMAFQSGVDVEAGGDTSAGLKDRVPKPGDLMLVLRQTELNLRVCEGQMCISW